MSVFRFFKSSKCPEGYTFNRKGQMVVQEFALPKTKPKPVIIRAKKSTASLRNANGLDTTNKFKKPTSEMVMKTDPKLPNLKLPGDKPSDKSKFMKRVILRTPKGKAVKEAQRLDPKCWDGYVKKGTKMKGGTRVNNCVKENETPKSDPVTPGYMSHMKKVNKGEVDKYPNRGKGIKKFDANKFFGNKPKVKEDMDGMSQKSGDKRSTDSGAGMTAQGVAKYNRRTGGDLKTAVTTPPSKLKKGSKAAGRRKSFCARSKSWNGERGKAARRRWNC